MKENKCRQCGYAWLPRIKAKPALCPKCRSQRWDRPEIKATINTAIAAHTDPDKIARLEVAREYFTNPDFRKRLSDYSFNQTYR